MEISMQDVIRICFSMLIGGVIGIEREYRTKPAGFRTLILISVGSTLFTLMSVKIGGPDNADRIASYILVGIGFIGSGVIFKEGLKVTGLTTAATIWITAALGMAAANGDFLLCLLVLGIVMSVLEIFSRFESVLDRFHASKIFVISFKADQQVMKNLEEEFHRISPGVHRISMKLKDDILTCVYKVEGGNERFKTLQKFLLQQKEVIGFEN